MNKGFSLEALVSYIPLLLEFLPVTLGIFAGALVIGLFFGIAFALMRVYRIPVLQHIVVGLVSYVRGVPLLVQLMLAYYILPAVLEAAGIPGNDFSPVFFIVSAYGLHAAVNYSEALRGAINSIPKGQTEAGLSIGMTTVQVLIRIIAPQAIVIALPDICNIMLIGMKSTALAFTVGVMDMVGRGQVLGDQTLRSFEVFLALSVIYYVMALILELSLGFAEKRLSRRSSTLKLKKAV